MHSNILNVTLLLCSDGSYDPRQGDASHGWVIASADGTIFWDGAGPDDGHPKLMSAYRSELGGLVVIIYIRHRLSQAFEITSGSAICYCNSSSALRNIFNQDQPDGVYKATKPDYDLICTAGHLLLQIQFEVKPKWVKGHVADIVELKHELNDIANTLAGTFQKGPPTPFDPH